MNYDDKIKKRTLETVLLIVVMSLYTIFGLYYIPYILLVFPAPFIVYSIKNDIIPNIINMIITGIIVGLVHSFEVTVILLIAFVPITFISSYLIKKRRSNLEILGVSTAVFFISTLIILSFVDAGGGGFIAILEDGFKQLLSTQLEMIEDMDLTTYQFLETKELLENAYKYLLLIIPAILLIMALVISYLNCLLASIGLRRMSIEIINVPKFSRFRLPNNVIPGIIVMFLGVYIMNKFKMPYYETVIINLIVLIGFMFIIQGLSVVDYFFIRIRIFPLIRVILYLLFLFNSPIVTVISMIGFIDTIFDLRRIKKSKS